MTDGKSLAPAHVLAARNTIRWPNESPEYRRARQALLTEEIELRRHLERVPSSAGLCHRVARSPRTIGSRARAVR